MSQYQIHRPVTKMTGPGTLFTKQGIYEESDTQKHDLGERLEVGDRVFYYSKAGAAITAGNVCEMPAYSGAATALENSNAVTVAAPAGSTRIYMNTTNAQTANKFAEGYAAIFDATTTGKCWLFRIKSHPAMTTSGTSNYIDLYDPIPEALTTDDQVSLMANMYQNIVQSPATTQAGACVGVAPISITSSSYYFWLQTYGPCQVYASESALVINETFSRTDAAVAGAVEKLSAIDSGSAETPVLGYTLHLGTQDEASIGFLTIRS